MTAIPRLFSAMLLMAAVLVTLGPPKARAQTGTNAAKTITVKGKVRDGKNTSLPGVTVVIKGTTKGTTTDDKGNFTINAVDPDATLVFHFIGYESQEIALRGQTSPSIVLKESEKQLDEYVVVAYGTQKKVTKTGAVSTVKGSEIKQAPTVNVSNALVGRVSGLVAMNSSGEPGYDGSSLLIRGRATLGNANPLVVIDGIPRDGLQRINPNDIENISVLKDASAAIYGSRAANGVILITTKRGKTSKPMLNYSFNQGFTQPTRLPEMADAATYAQVQNEINIAGGVAPSHTPEEIEKYRNGSDPWGYPNTDWLDAAIKPISLQNRHDLSVRGGNEKILYFVSLGTLYQDGIYRNSATKYRQHNLRANIDANINRYLTLRLDLAGRLEDRNFPPRSAGSIFRALLRGRPTEAAIWPNGLPGPDIEYGDNPVVTGTNEIGYQRDRNYVLNNNLGLLFYVPGVEGLFIDGNFALDNNFDFNKKFTKPWTLYSFAGYNANGEPILNGAQRGVSAPELEEWYTQGQTITINGKINYSRTFGKHYLSTFVAVERSEAKGDNLYALRRYFISDLVDQIFAGADKEKNNGGGGYEYARLNYFGRVSYNYREKYLFDFNWRYDGSQNFPSNKRFGFFPGVSAGWVLSSENFWKNNIGANVSDYFKLRASWGQLGNDQIDNFQYLTTYGLSGTGVMFGDELNKAIYQTRTPNPDITWEVSNKYDVGFEAKFLNGLIGVEADYFFEKRSNILSKRRASIPAYTGLVLPDENIGRVQNQGFELQLNHKRTINKFTYEIAGNVYNGNNKILFWDEEPNVPAWQKSTGKQIGSTLYYEAIGIFRDQKSIDEYPHLADARPGDVIFKDVNNDTVINDLDRVRNNQTATPSWVFGVTMAASYKGFDITMLWQGAAGARQYLRTESGLIGNFPMKFVEDRWTESNIDGSWPRPYDRDREYWVSRPNTWWYWDTDYFRLKTLELGYTLPEKWRKRVGLDDLRIYVSGQNLVTFDKVKIFDPELPSGSGQYYPQTKIYNVGLNLTF